MLRTLQRLVKPTTLTAVLVMVAIMVPACSGSKDITVSIIEPAKGATVTAGKPVTVEADLEGAELAESMNDTSAGHIHVYVDGKIASMPLSTTSTVVLKPGDHEIEVEYVDPDHKSLDPPVIASVEVTAEK